MRNIRISDSRRGGDGVNVSSSGESDASKPLDSQ